jgi:hypothetical protein
MSDTPRTNLEAFFPHESMYQVCDADFCRQLERELNAANDRIKRLEKSGDAMVSHAKALGMGGTGLVQRWNKAKEDKL